MFDTLATSSVAASASSSSSSSSSSSASTVSCFPSGGALLCIKLVGQLFSVSDARHPVVTPHMLFIAQCLAQVPVRGGRCVAAALFLVNTLFTYVLESKRFVPEVVAFLHELLVKQFGLGAVAASASASAVDSAAAAAAAAAAGSGESIALWARAAASKDVARVTATQLNLQALFLESNDDAHFESAEFACASLRATLHLLNKAAALYAQLPSFPELFRPHADALARALAEKRVPGAATAKNRCDSGAAVSPFSATGTRLRPIASGFCVCRILAYSGNSSTLFSHLFDVRMCACANNPNTA